MVRAAEDEDVDLIGVSCSMGRHKYFVTEIFRMLDERNLRDIPIIFGGVIPPRDTRELLESGIKAAFGPGTPLAEITKFVTDMAGKMEKERLA